MLKGVEHDEATGRYLLAGEGRSLSSGEMVEYYAALGERLAKHDQLLRIEERLGVGATFAGAAALTGCFAAMKHLAASLLGNLV